MAKAKSAPTTSIFGGAPVITAAAPKKANKAFEVVLPGTETVAALDAVIAALTALRVEEARKVKEIAEDRFVTEGVTLKRRPENFKAIEGRSSASVQLRVKSQALTEDGIALCKEHGIVTEEAVTIPETFVFESAYASDSTFVRRMETLLGPQLLELQDHRGPIIKKQEGVSKFKISESGLHQIFTHDKAIVREFLPVAFTLAIRAKLDTNGDLSPAIRIAEHLLGTPLGAEVAKAAASDAAGLEEKTKKKAA